MRQFVEMMWNGEFMSKNPDEAWSYLDMLAENAQSWDTSDKPNNSKPTQEKGGIYVLKEEDDVNARITNLTRKVEAMELSKSGVPKSNEAVETICGICLTDLHATQDCPTIPAFQEVLHEHVNATYGYQRPVNGPVGNTYNNSWKNHPNFSWKNAPTGNPTNSQGGPPMQNIAPPQFSIEDTLKAFMQGQM